MRTTVHIISGFLGAGKTTLIEKLIRDCFLGKKVALIENDFGEISVDAALLKSGGVEVRELNSGCICCSLTGDFVSAMRELTEKLRPDIILIEPSGVGKLSEIMAACANPRLKDLIEVEGCITVVDVKRCRMYLDNFGEFFEDQVKYADTVVLSRVEEFPDQVESARELVLALNKRATIVDWPMNVVSGEDILRARADRRDGFPRPFRLQIKGGSGPHGPGCRCHEGEAHSRADRSSEHALNCRCHEHGVHGPNCGCHGHGAHGHDADEVFETLTVRLPRKVSMEELGRMLTEIAGQGGLIRAKGILPCLEGQVSLQYVPDQLEIRPCAAEGNALCLIGRNLDRALIERVFDAR